jgi:hypothetical protein
MRYRAIVPLAFAAFLVCAASEATVVIGADLKKLTTDAQAIVHGRVVAVQSQWAEDGRRIETVVTLQANDYLKGNFGAQVVFRVPGGRIGRLRSVRVGAPTFQPGDEVVVFLGASGPAVLHVVGFNQGVFRVAVDARSGQRTVSSPLLDGTTAVRVARPIVRGDPSRKPVPLAQFQQRVQSILEQQHANRVAVPRAKQRAANRQRVHQEQ